jgi:hypothetical protein
LAPIVVSLALGYAIQAIINAIVGPPKKSKRGRDESPTYDFDTPQNTTANGTPISIVYGKIRVAGHVLQAKTKVLDDGRVVLSELIGIGEGGDTGVQSIDGITQATNGLTEAAIPATLEINGNPASTYKDITYSVRMGSKHQSIVPGFEDTVLLTTPFDSTLLFNVDFTYTGTNQVDAIEIKILFPSGLFKVSTDVAPQAHTIDYQVRWRKLGTGVDLGSINKKVTRKSRQSFQISHRITGLEKTVYQVFVKRLTADDVVLTKQSEMHLIEVSEIINNDLAYVGKALAAVEVIATDQLHGSQPNLTFLVEGIKVRVYTDLITFAYQFSQNPSWIILDLFLNFIYGLGNQISINDIDIQSFIDFAGFCDEMVVNGEGVVEKRCEIDLGIDSINDAWEWVYDIAQTAQASIFIIGGKYRIRADRASTPVMMFTPSNMTEVKLGYTPPKDRINYVEAHYFDRELNFREEVTVGLDPAVQSLSNYIKEEIQYKGITRRSQAIRLANYRINSNKVLTRYAKWIAEIAAVRCEPNDVVEVAHASANWGLYTGYTYDATPSTFHPGQEIIIESGKTYKIRVWHISAPLDASESGKFEEQVISSVPGVYTVLTINGNWIQVPQKYSPFSIAELTTTVKQFKIVDVKLRPDYKVDLLGFEYNTAVYSDTIISLPDTAFNTGFDAKRVLPDISDLSVTQRALILPDGTIDLVLDVSFNPPVSPIFDHSDIWIKFQSDTIWSDTPVAVNVKGGYARITGDFSLGDALHVAVTPATVFGVRKHPSQVGAFPIVLDLSSSIPANVTGFTVTRFSDILKFYWNPVADKNVNSYEIRQNSAASTDWEGAPVLATRIFGTTYETSSFFSDSGPTTTTFLIKAINTAGNYSALATTILTVIDPRIEHNVIKSINWRTFGVTTGWPGTLTNLVRSGVFPNETLEITNTAQQAIYETTIVDVEASIQSLTSFMLSGSQIDPFFTWDTAGAAGCGGNPFSWDSVCALGRTWQGLIGEKHLILSPEWKFADSLGVLATNSYETFVATGKKYRYAQFRIRANLDNPSFDGNIEQFNTLIDVPDIITSVVQVITGGTGLISYTKPFNSLSSIAKEVVITGGAQGDNFTISAETLTSFTVNLFNSVGSALLTPTTVNVIAKGY